MTTYVAKAANGWWKCGCSHDPFQRVSHLPKTCPTPPGAFDAGVVPSLFHVFDVTRPWDRALEQRLLDTYFANRWRPYPTHQSEWFQASEEYVADVCRTVSKLIRLRRDEVERALLFRVTPAVRNIAAVNYRHPILSERDEALLANVAARLGSNDEIRAFIARCADAYGVRVADLIGEEAA